MPEGFDTGLPAQTVNAAFAQKVHEFRGGSGVEKLAAALTQSVRHDILQERESGRAFCDAVIKPKQISAREFQIIGDTDIPYKYEYVDVEHPRALSVNFAGGTDAHLVRARRYAIGLFPIFVEKITFEVLKLRFHPINIRDLVLKKVDESVQDTKDRQMLVHVDGGLMSLYAETVADPGITASEATADLKPNRANIEGGGSARVTAQEIFFKGAAVKAANGDDFALYPLDWRDITQIKQAFVGTQGRRMSVQTTLMTDYDKEWFSELDYNEIGGDFTRDTFKRGVKLNEWQGTRMVFTNKTHILRPGNLYFFANEKFYGRHYVVDPLQLFIDASNFRFVHIEGFTSCGIGLGNLWGCKKLELYGGSAMDMTVQGEDLSDAGEGDTPAYAPVKPLSEEQLQTPDNFAELANGVVYPPIVQF